MIGTPNPNAAPASADPKAGPARFEATLVRNIRALGDRLHAAGTVSTAPAPPATPVSATNPRRDGDTESAADRVPLNLPAINADGHAAASGPPILIEGLSPPWLLRRIIRETPPTELGETRLILGIEHDLTSFRRALAAVDLVAELADPRVHLFAGPSAVELLARFLEARSGLLAPAGLFRTPAADTQPQDRLVNALKLFHSDEQRRQLETTRRVHALPAPTPSDRPRVAVIASRFSSYLDHAAADLVRSFARLGCETLHLREPDEASRLTALGYAAAFDAFRPDLIVAINHPRARLGPAQPPAVPWITWIQDRMPHLLDRQTAAAAKNNDYLVGHTIGDLFEGVGFDRRRAAYCDIGVCVEKFHPGPIAPDDAARYDCEVACVTNHAETPEALRDRLAASMREPGVADIVRDLHAFLSDLLTRETLPPVSAHINVRIRALLPRYLPGAADDAALRIRHLIAWPLADRIIRHRVLLEAAEIADRRGWRFHLYGRGWHNHPRLSPYAKGPLEHGEPLRAAYRAARAHLHASAHGHWHQRPAECALSGGLPLVRTTHDALETLVRHARAAALDAAPEDDPPRVADHPDAMRAAAALARVRPELLAQFQAGGVLSCPVLPPRHWNGLGGCPRSRDELWFMGDPDDAFFTDARDLETKLEAAVTRPDWRRSLADGIRRRVLAHRTLEAVAGRMLDIAGIARPSARVAA